VMDDALVNFDDARARLAARVLVEFVTEQGAGRQMLVLTCHEHVAEMCRAAGAVGRPLSGGARSPRRAPPRPAPVVVEPVMPLPAPVPVVPPPVAAPGAWPAEEFFFGGVAAHEPAAARTPPPRRAAPRPRRRRG
ncbi:MAG: ATP-binding protein, partial [Planctomycetaceae bacterium]